MALEENLEPMITFLDLDGVIVDFYGAVSKELGFTTTFEHDALYSYFGNDEAKVKNYLHSLSADWWASIPKFEWADDLIDLATSYGEIAYLSSPGHYPNAGAGKILFAKHVLNTEHLILAKTKSLIAAPKRVLIDDTPYNCAAFKKAGGDSYLWPSSTDLRNSPSLLKTTFKEVQILLDLYQ